MTCALAGSHRVGKSTLARHFAEQTGLLYVTSQAGPIAQRMGFGDMSKPLTFEQRMSLQEAILEQHILDMRRAYKDAKELGHGFISDRSTLDMAAYALCEWGMRAQGEPADRLVRYVDDCMSVAGELYPMVVIVQPGIVYVEEPNKPPPSRSYQELFNRICIGLGEHEKLGCPVIRIEENVLDLEARATRLGEIWVELFEEARETFGDLVRH